MISDKQAGTTRIEPVKRTGNNCLVGDVDTWQEGKKRALHFGRLDWIGLDGGKCTFFFFSFLFLFPLLIIFIKFYGWCD